MIVKGTLKLGGSVGLDDAVLLTLKVVSFLHGPSLSFVRR